jgi:hypothetical protein
MIELRIELNASEEGYAKLVTLVCRLISRNQVENIYICKDGENIIDELNEESEGEIDEQYWSDMHTGYKLL